MNELNPPRNLPASAQTFPEAESSLPLEVAVLHMESSYHEPSFYTENCLLITLALVVVQGFCVSIPLVPLPSWLGRRTTGLIPVQAAAAPHSQRGHTLPGWKWKRDWAGPLLSVTDYRNKDLSWQVRGCLLTLIYPGLSFLNRPCHQVGQFQLGQLLLWAQLVLTWPK